MPQVTTTTKHAFRRLLRVTIGVGLTALAVLAAGCGSSSSSSSSGSSSASSSGSTATVAASSTAAASQCEAAARAALAPISGTYKPPAPLPAFDIKKVKNKNVWVVNVISAGYTNGSAQGFAQAARAAGFTPHVYTANGSLPSITAGVQEALAQNAGGILLDADPLQAVVGILGPAVKKGVVVVATGAEEPSGPSLNTAYAVMGINWAQIGAYVADGGLLATNCKGHFLLPGYPYQAILKDYLDGAAAQVKKLCPTACSAHIVDIDTTLPAGQQAAALATAITRYPDTNFVLPESDLTALNTYPVVKSHGLKDGSVNCDPPNLPALNSHAVQLFDICQPPPAYFGWANFDMLARGMAGVAPPTAAEVTQAPFYFSPTTEVNLANPFPQYSGYQSAYLHAWGVG